VVGRAAVLWMFSPQKLKIDADPSPTHTFVSVSTHSMRVKSPLPSRFGHLLAVSRRSSNKAGRGGGGRGFLGSSPFSSRRGWRYL